MHDKIGRIQPRVNMEKSEHSCGDSGAGYYSKPHQNQLPIRTKNNLISTQLRCFPMHNASISNNEKLPKEIAPEDQFLSHGSHDEEPQTCRLTCTFNHGTFNRSSNKKILWMDNREEVFTRARQASHGISTIPSSDPSHLSDVAGLGD
eukprot:jgi/Bigna1/137941/aug1.42_g12649